MKALLLQALLYVAKTIAADVIKKKFLKDGATPEAADIVARIQAAKLEHVSNQLK